MHNKLTNLKTNFIKFRNQGPNYSCPIKFDVLPFGSFGDLNISQKTQKLKFIKIIANTLGVKLTFEIIVWKTVSGPHDKRVIEILSF